MTQDEAKQILRNAFSCFLDGPTEATPVEIEACAIVKRLEIDGVTFSPTLRRTESRSQVIVFNRCFGLRDNPTGKLAWTLGQQFMNKSIPTSIKTILTKHFQWHYQQRGGEQADLSGINLSGLDLSHVILDSANLQGANLGRASLHYADLWGANLEGANLKNTDLEDADLTKANFKNANLRRANLDTTYLTDANFDGASMEEVSMCLAWAKGASFIGADLRDSDLSSAYFDEANLYFASLAFGDLKGVSFERANLEQTSLEGATLWEADLTHSKGYGAILTDADFEFANFVGSEGWDLNQPNVNTEHAVGLEYTIPRKRSYFPFFRWFKLRGFSVDN